MRLRKKGSPISILASATGPVLSIPQVGRTNAGVYSLLVTNRFGSAFSSNAVLKVQVPMQLSGPRLVSGGSFQAGGVYADAWVAQPADLVRFEVQASSDLVNWGTVTNALSISSGRLLLNCYEATNYPTRFYRIVEHP